MPRLFLSKLNLTAHVAFSTGWLGAVCGFLCLAITGIVGENPQAVRSMYIGMEVIAWFVIIPFCISSLLTGIMQSLITQWGLFKHYWIVIKLILTVIATVLLLLHMQPIGEIASVAQERSLDVSEMSGVRVRLIADAGVAIFVLLIATALSIYKPFGRIGVRIDLSIALLRQQSLGFYVILGMVLLFIVIIMLHLFGISLGHH